MNKKDAKNIIYKVLQMIASFSVTFAITKIVVKNSGQELYGFYSLAVDFVSYATVISLALNSMAGRYITIKYHENDYKETNIFFNTILYANIILAIIIMVPMVFVVFNLNRLISVDSSIINEVKMLFLLMFVNFLISIVASVFSVATFVTNRVDMDSKRQIESNILKIIIIIGLYSCFSSNIGYLGIATLLSTIYIFALNVYYTKKLTPEIQIFKKDLIALDRLKELLESGIWNSVTRLSAIILSGLDLLIANLFVGGVAMGTLSIAKTIPKYLFSAIGSFSSAFSPKITIEYAKGNKKTVIDYTISSIKLCGLISNVVAVVIVSLGTRLYDLWVPGENSTNLQLITIISIIGMIFVMPLEPVWTIFTAANKVKTTSIYLIIESVFSVSVVFGLLMFSNKELYSLLIIAGTSSFFEIIRGVFFIPIYASNVLGVSKKTFYPSIIRSVTSFTCGLIICTVINVIIRKNNWMILLFLAGAYAIITTIVCLYISLDKNERKALYDKFAKKMKGSNK